MTHRRTCVAAIISVMVVGLLHGQQGQPPGTSPPRSSTRPPLAFEVATVKPSDPGARGLGISPLPGGQTYVATNAQLRVLIKLMFGITDSQIVGGPDWMNTARFDIRARAERPSSLDDLHEMFQTLIEDRFKLRFHRETRTVQAYVLSVDKTGLKMQRNESLEGPQPPIQGERAVPPAPVTVTGTRVSMWSLCLWLGKQMEDVRQGRPVADQTGLSGFYDFKLTYAPDLSAFPATPGGPPLPTFDGPDLFIALRQQLGLKLDAMKAPVEVFVIDSLEKPSEN